MAGSIARSPVAPAPIAVRKLNVVPFQLSCSNVEPLRPSSQVSICCAVTTGTPRALAEATIAVAPGELTASVCMFALNAP